LSTATSTRWASAAWLSVATMFAALAISASLAAIVWAVASSAVVF
jgi:hypothetical protein